MKNSKSGRNATKSTSFALEEKRSSRREPASQGDVEAVETLDLDVISKGGGRSACGVDESNDFHEAPFASTASLAVMLGQLVAYFTGRANVDDMDVLSFSLHHLFCRVDFLYRKALPALQARLSPRTGADKLPHSTHPPSRPYKAVPASTGRILGWIKLSAGDLERVAED